MFHIEADLTEVDLVLHNRLQPENVVGHIDPWTPCFPRGRAHHDYSRGLRDETFIRADVGAPMKGISEMLRLDVILGASWKGFNPRVASEITARAIDDDELRNAVVVQVQVVLA